MTHIGVLKPDTYVRILNWVGLPCVVLYFVSMVIFPWLHGGWDWHYVQRVWHAWQSLNVAMLAFLASIVAFNIGRYNAEKQRERNFTAAQAFLPESLSELVSYFKDSAKVFEEAWERRNAAKIFQQHQPLTTPVPILPSRYKEVFARAIEHAEPDVARYLAKILVHLQIHHARMRELHNAFGPNSTLIITAGNVKSYLHQLAELQALISRLYPFARNIEAFNGAPLSWEDFHNAYANLNVYPEQYDDLAEFTRCALEK